MSKKYPQEAILTGEHAACLRQRKLRRLTNSAYGDTRIYSRNARQSRYRFFVHALKIGHVGYDDAEQIIELAGHEVTLHDFRQVLHSGLECGEFALSLSLQSNMNKDISRETGLALIEEGGVFLDKPLFLQPPHPPETGGFRQAHEAGEIYVADAAVVLKGAQDRPVEFIDIHSGLLRR